MACIVCCHYSTAQNNFRAIVKGGHLKEPLPGATVTVSKLNKRAAADSSGQVLITEIPAGKYKIRFTYAGLEDKEQEFEFSVVNCSSRLK